MVDSFILRQVEESFDKDFTFTEENSLNSSTLDDYKKYLTSPLFKKVSTLPLETFSSNKFSVETSKNCLLHLNDEVHSIEIGGVEPLLSHIMVIVPKGFNGKLLLRELNPKANVEVSIFMDKYSNLEVGREVYSTRYSKISIYANQKAKCRFVGAYDISGAESLLFTNGYLLGESSHIDISMHGIAKNMAKVTNDTQVTIAHEAPHSEGHQHMKNIIWDSFSRISSKPTLEIQNNNVECSHGASVYKLSQEIKTYGNARGISDTDLVDLVAQGFFSPIRDLQE